MPANKPTPPQNAAQTTADPALASLQSTKNAALAVILGPLDKTLTELQQPGVNHETVLQDLFELQLQELQNTPLIESLGIGGVAAAAQAELRRIVGPEILPTA